MKEMYVCIVGLIFDITLFLAKNNFSLKKNLSQFYFCKYTRPHGKNKGKKKFILFKLILIYFCTTSFEE
jgi:hypothetical protein